MIEDGTGAQVITAPSKKRADKPPRLNGYTWRDDGAGWQLRRSVVVDGKRQRRYVGHLSKSAFRELKRKSGRNLSAALQEWAQGREV